MASLDRPKPSSGGTNAKGSFLQRPRSRSRLARLLLVVRVDYLQWVCIAAAFFFLVVFFESYLSLDSTTTSATNIAAWRRELGGLEFGDGIRFEPTRLLERFDKERREAREEPLVSRSRSGALRPRVALVVPHLSVDGTQLQMVTVAVAFKEMGYDIEVLSLDDGPVRSIWVAAGFFVSILSHDNKLITIDWLNYNGVLVNSLEAMPVMTRLSQEPFKTVPVIWTIYEQSLALRLEECAKTNNTRIISNWKQVFQRSSVVAFPNHFLSMLYRKLDTGNYYVIPGSPIELWKSGNDISLHKQQDQHHQLGKNSKDFLIAIVGSMFSYSGLLLEQALVLQEISQSSIPHLKVGFLLGNMTNSDNASLEDIAFKFGFSKTDLYQFDTDEDKENFLNAAKIVLYGSFFEEQSFPPILIQAMRLGKLIVAPDLSIIREFVEDGVNAYVFPKDNTGMLLPILSQAIFNGELSPIAKKVSSNGKELAKNLLTSETIEGYAFLLNNILKLPSEVEIPKDVTSIPSQLRKKWRWELFQNISHMANPNASDHRRIVDELEGQQCSNQAERPLHSLEEVEDAFSPINWTEERAFEKSDARKRILAEELKDRTDRSHGTWEEVYRNVKRASRFNKLHVVDDRELERTGQPLCIYEPYLGDGTWPFLHNTSLYRGVGLSTKGRRRGGDDVDASVRLPILTNPYYRDALGQHGALFAIANRIDRIHKNAWIGFQSWRVTAAKASLSKKGESMLLEVIESRKFGDALFFWSRMDNDPRNTRQHDFWSFCDSINAGNCRFAVSRALKRMYGIQGDWDSLPPMPADGGGSWSVMYSWALPTRSFLEFVMFSRIFVDALDADIYDEHHENGTCYLSLSKDRHCYSRVLELLVNMWAYHSARRMVYVDPETGAMEEQHHFKIRRGKMWIKWFSHATLKGMDMELAEEWDLDDPDPRRLWPKTGEVIWPGIQERERALRRQERRRRERQRKARQMRIRRQSHQKALGK